MNLFPCQNTRSVSFTYNANIITSPSLWAFTSASESSHKRSSFFFRQHEPVNGIVLAIGAVEEAQIRNSAIFGEHGIVHQAQEHFGDLPEYMTYLQELTGPGELPKILLMPPTYHHPYTAHPNLVFFNSALVASDGSHLPTVIKAITESRLSRKKTKNDWFLDGLTIYIGSKMHSKFFGQQSDQFHNHIVWQNSDKEPVSGLTPWRAFIMLTELEKRFDRNSFQAVVRDFICQDEKITFTEFRRMVSRRLPGGNGVNSLNVGISWDDWGSHKAEMPIVPDYDGSFEEMPLELAKSWIEKPMPLFGVYEALAPAQKVCFFDILLDQSFNSETANGITNLYRPQDSQDLRIQTRWMLMIISKKIYSHYPQIADLLQRIFIQEYCLPVYKKLLDNPDLDKRLWTLEVFGNHRRYLHPTLTAMIEQRISFTRPAVL